ncbi:hypothetical protein [Burkholderia territorii]|uniref:hypothetical protein n=1 Tax=Burkholderia territorii TaxID=1503055 RepID=UPI0012D95E32|nr:hypothetical protein [Burkholderia territorii]
MQQTDGTSSNGLHKTVLNEVDDLSGQLKLAVADPRVASTMKQVVDLVATIHDDLAKRVPVRTALGAVHTR